MAGRRPVTALGKLFGSDTAFEVLDAVAKRGKKPFCPSDLTSEVSATPAAIGAELSKLEGLGILEHGPSPRDGRRRPLQAGDSALAACVLELPKLIRERVAR